MATWSGLWNFYYQDAYSRIQKYTTTERGLNRVLNRARGARRTKAVLMSLLGVAPGAAYSSTYKRVPASAQFSWGNSGKITPETVTLLSGTSSAGDVTYLTNLLNAKMFPTSYPVEKSGYPQGGAVNRIA